MDVLMCVIIGGYLSLFYNELGWQKYNVILLLFLYLGIRFVGKINMAILYYALLLICFALIVHGYLQYFEIMQSGNAFFKITGIYKNPSVYTGIILLIIIIPVGYVISNLRYKRFSRIWIISLVLVSLTLILLILSRSRAAYVGLSISTFYMILQCYRININWTLKNILLTIVLCGIIGGCGYGVYLYKKDSADGRVLIWKISMNMIKDKPVTGFGPEGFKEHYMHYQAEYLKKSNDNRIKSIAGSNHLAYNEIIRIWIEYGILGLGAYIAILALFLSISGKSQVIYSLKGVVVGYIVWGMFNYPKEVLNIQILIIVVFALLAKRMNPIKRITKASSIILRCVIVLMLIFVSIKERDLSVSYNAYAELLSSYKGIDQYSLIVELNRLEKDLRYEPGYWAFYCTALYHFHDTILLKDKIYSWIRIFPSPGNYLLLGDMYFRNKEYEHAEQAYEKAHNMAPSRQAARGKLIWLYKETGREEQARLLANEVLCEGVKIYGFETYKLHLQIQDLFGK
ncbi:MAG: O-antigen ligase family protein [Bacteroides graminisolvens]|nr:O-antigen ligase family protein [Bacteroides graminisolvens]